MKINVKALSVTCGILWGGIILLMTLWLVVRGLQSEPIIFELVYPGYSISGIGSIIGLMYGFIDGLIFGFIAGKLYNFLLDAHIFAKKNTA